MANAVKEPSVNELMEAHKKGSLLEDDANRTLSIAKEDNILYIHQGGNDNVRYVPVYTQVGPFSTRPINFLVLKYLPEYDIWESRTVDKMHHMGLGAHTFSGAIARLTAYTIIDDVTVGLR